jgi:Domain of unknown function (DUF5615)
VTLQLYFDEDTMDKGLVTALRARGADVLTALEADMIERQDDDHLKFATANGRVLYSFNVGDYCRLQAEGRTHAGLILAQQQHYSAGEQMRRLLRLINTLTAEEMQNRIEFLSRWQV